MTQALPDSRGRLTLPIETGMDEEIRSLLERLGADAVRNSDGTELPDLVHELAAKVYSTYFVGRGDNAWAREHPEAATRIFLSSPRVVADAAPAGPVPTATASDAAAIQAPGSNGPDTTEPATAPAAGVPSTDTPAAQPLVVDLMTEWFADQVAPDTDCDLSRWWQVLDRTTGATLPAAAWELHSPTQVRITAPEAGHVYSVSFLARQLWDPTQMYNYLTNGWESDPTREKEMPFDVRDAATWAHVREHLEAWLQAHPEIDVVRFTTFFYHFTLVYGPDAKEKFVDWFGYSASVSVPALEAFEEEYGYALTPEDFVDEGYYNSPFRLPSRAFKDWIDFQHGFVTARVRELTDAVHASGKEAMMFLGDNWIGTEPYGPHFAEAGLDAVVGSVGSGATCRMIADIPHVRYTEGRFLPYFFPDVFHPGGDPVSEANESWLQARRAIVRSPLDRIGYGGYLSLATQHPDFIDRVEEIVAEFRALHERTGGEKPLSAPITVGILNAWGTLRSWQTHMVAHALWYRQTYTYLGVLEALSGLPVTVRFLSFEQMLDGELESPGEERIDVLINAGAAQTAFSGGAAWEDPALVAAINSFVRAGGGFIGVGEPSFCPRDGASFQLRELLGVDQELGWGLSTNRPMPLLEEHFLTADLPGALDEGEGTANVIVTDPSTQVLRESAGQVRLAVHESGAGRAIYASGLPYSAENSRLLLRALFWAAGRESEAAHWMSSDPRVEVAHYPGGQCLAFNNALEAVTAEVPMPGGGAQEITLEAGGYRWL